MFIQDNLVVVIMLHLKPYILVLMIKTRKKNFVERLLTGPCLLKVRNTLNVCICQTYVARHKAQLCQTYVARHTYSHTARELGRVVMVMEVHFICSGPVLRRGVGRKGVCVSIWGGGITGGEAGRSI